MHNASIAIVDEDHSDSRGGSLMRSCRLYFQPPQQIAERDIVRLMNSGRYTFVIDIPPNFERDVLADATPRSR